MHSIGPEIGEPYTIENPGDFELARNSSFLRNVRVEMMNGNRPKMCAACFELEDFGIESYRQRMTKRFESIQGSLIEETTSDGYVLKQVSYLHIRLGNFCNLKCRMCDPISSNRLMEELEETYSETAKGRAKISKLKKVGWFKNKVSWEEIEKLLPNIDQIYIVGGEPFLIKEAFEFLELLDKSGHSKKIELNYHTNLTHLPKEIFSLWPKFKNINLYVSLDGFDRINHYIRYPSNWKVLDKNLHLLDSSMSALNCGKIEVNCTVQVYNVFSLSELFWHLKENFKNISPYPNFEPVMYRPHLSIQLLNRELKILAENGIRKISVDHFYKYGGLPPKQFSDRLNQIIRYMWAKDQSAEIPEFKKFTNFMDLNRGQNVLNFIPELGPLMLQADT
jgi:MoaA/NifB/PqqE/SkfB family radical SAM enzyme